MKRTVRLLVAVLPLTLLLAVLGGCWGGGHALDGTRWKLSGWSANSLDPSKFEITAEFADGKLSGKSAVNGYGGAYQAGPGAAFSAGQLSSTLMASADPDAMRAETIYTDLLAHAASYKIDGGKLLLLDSAGNETLIFESTSK